jgi:ferredoxin/flavodoxin
MQTAIIYVFSGTFNTLKAAGMISDSLAKRGVSATVCEIKKPFENIPLPEGVDWVGFGYPVHAFNIPEVLFQFVKRLPNSKQKVFIFKTSGEPSHFNDGSSHLLWRLLTRKGYDVMLETHMLMPYNILFRYPDSLAKQMYLYTEAQSRQLAIRVTSGECDNIRFHVRHIVFSFLFRIEWPGAKFNGLLCSVNSKKCTQCGLCTKMCPTGNIRIENSRVRFGGQCAMCMRCAMFCPKDAVRFGLVQLWKINGAYNFKRLIADPGIPSDYVRDDTKGYFRYFRRFYRQADVSLAKYGIYVNTESMNDNESFVSVDSQGDSESEAVNMS